ncbi:MAG TPA: hypothetical protein VFB07_09705 [Vicinamibacterales bacterium]|nr:hypothetical protein [Vicinamibacterales bacterium]
MAGGSVRESIAPGESGVFTIDVPAGSAAHVVVHQDGIDLSLMLRRQGAGGRELLRELVRPDRSVADPIRVRCGR